MINYGEIFMIALINPQVINIDSYDFFYDIYD